MLTKRAYQMPSLRSMSNMILYGDYTRNTDNDAVDVSVHIASAGLSLCCKSPLFLDHGPVSMSRYLREIHPMPICGANISAGSTAQRRPSSNMRDKCNCCKARC